MPVLVAIFLTSRWAGSLATRFGPRLPMIAGPIVAALGFVLLGQQGIGGNYWLGFFPAFCLIGVGLALGLTPVTIAGMAAVSADIAGVGSGILNASARVGNLLVTTFLAAFLVLTFTQALSTTVQGLNLPPEIANAVMEQRLKLAGAQPPQGTDETTRARISQAVHESFIAGFRVISFICAGILFMSALSALFLIENVSAGRVQEAMQATASADPLG
jgi:MFS family permease